jgi:hypothetical protein
LDLMNAGRFLFISTSWKKLMFIGGIIYVQKNQPLLYR